MVFAIGNRMRIPVLLQNRNRNRRRGQVVMMISVGRERGVLAIVVQMVKILRA